MTRTTRIWVIVIMIGIGLIGCRKQVYGPITLDQTLYEIEDGFQLTCIASEPFIDAPVALDWDDKGRMWVVEMIGYMPNIDGTGEDEPNGRIVILEDSNQDGLIDQRKTFLSQLVLPRAILHAYGGMLYSEPPFLYFIEIENDQPGKKTVVDSAYAVGGNVEHQANGLLMNIDNWIYNAKSNVRYRRSDEGWMKEYTTFRGQWGITKDDYGRLYYNDNSNQLKGDYVLPQAALHNPYQVPRNTLNRQINEDQRVYPLQATAVNRGYMEGMLDAEEKLRRFTSACGPVIYRGGAWQEEYIGNSFVCAPEANLVKRNIHTQEGSQVTAQHAYLDREYIASWDLGFRPVNLYNGPDGSIYVIDMHRGIIQHKSYMTSYLRQKILEQGLDSIADMGRILKISHQEQSVQQIPDFHGLATAELINLFDHPNGWVRDKAQQLIIHKNAPDVPDHLITYINEQTRFIPLLHAMWALEGLGILNQDQLEVLLQKNAPVVQGQAFYLLANMVPGDMGENELKRLIDQLLDRLEVNVDLYVANGIGMFSRLDDDFVFDRVFRLAKRYPGDRTIAEMAMSGLGDRVQGFNSFLDQNENELTDWKEICQGVIQNQEVNQINRDLRERNAPMEHSTRGLIQFREVCGVCHGSGGDGMDGLAPSLVSSEIMKGDVEKYVSVALHGLSSERSDPSKGGEFNAPMPGIGETAVLSDIEIARMLNFIRNAFGTAPQTVTAEMVRNTRAQPPEGGIWTRTILDQEFNELTK